MKHGLKCILAMALFLPALLPAQSAKWETMPLEQVKPGMKGYGLTVFKGETPEKFDVEIIDVLHNTMPKQSMILARLSGHGLEKSGVIAGMSGSPVIMDGRIIGAIAYAWSFTTEPIAGITPIESMLGVMRHPVEPHDVARRPLENVPPLPSSGDFVPVMSPLMVSGVPSLMMGALEKTLSPYRLMPVRAGGGDYRAPSPRLEPGSAIGVTMVRGDIEMSAIGTATYIIGDQVLAFGHPFLGGGQVSFPMTAAKVLTVLPSLRISTKMGLATGEVGRLVQDRQGGISGVIGQKASMTPVVINVSNPTTGHKEAFNMELAWHTSFSPKMLDILVQSSLVSAETSIGENTLAANLKIKFKNHPLITLQNSYFNSQGPHNKQLLEPLQRLIFNPFEEVRLESFEADLSVNNHIMLANISRIWMEEDVARAGETVHLHVMLRPFKGKEIDYPVDMEVPRSLRPGQKFMVGVAGGRELMPPVAPPVDFDGYVKLFTEAYSSTDMVVVRQMPTVGGIANGLVMEDLPSSALRMLGATNSTGHILRQDLNFTPIHTDWLVTGKASLSINVE